MLSGKLGRDLIARAERDPQLASLVADVKASLSESCSQSTLKCYTGCLRRFSEFCDEHNRKWTRAKTADVVFYLQKRKKQGLTAPTLAQDIAAISWAFSTAGRSDPTKHKLVAAILSAAKRKVRTIKRAEPASVKHLRYMANWLKSKGGFSEQRAFILSMVALGTCSRWGDVFKMKRGDVRVGKNSVRINISRSKTDQFNEGHMKWLPRAPYPEICPVIQIAAWLDKKQVGKLDSDPLFPHGNKSSEVASYSMYRTALRNMQVDSGLVKLTGHSWRHGFVASAISHGTDPWDVQQHGNWAQISSLKSYAHTNKKKRLAVAASLYK